MSASPSRYSWFLPGLLCVTMGVVVPSSVWVDILRPNLTDPVLRATLVDGAFVFRIALFLLGALLLLVGRFAQKAPAPASAAPQEPLSRRSTQLLWAMLGIALVLRVIQLGSGLWHDEIATLVNYGSLSPGEILTTYDSQNQHFLYSLLARPALAVFGPDAFALRLPAVLFGVAAIAALFFFARAVGRPVEAWLAAALMTFSYHHVWFSQNARGYTALLFWTILSSWFFVRGIDRGRDSDWVGFAFSAALGVFTHLTMAFVIAGQLLIYVFVRATSRGTRGRPVWLEFLMGFGLGGLLVLTLYAFVLPQIVAEFTTDASGVEFETWQNPLWTLLETVRSLEIGFAGGAAAVVGFAVFVIGCVSWLRSRPIVAFLFALPVGICAVVTVATGHNFWPRLFFFAMGFGILIVIRGILVIGRTVDTLLRVPERWTEHAGIASAVLAIVVSASTLPRAYGPKQDYEGASAFVHASQTEGDAVLTAGMASFALREYLHEDWTPVETSEQLAAHLGTGRRTWFVYSFPPYMEAMYPDVFSRLSRDFRVVEEFHGTLGGGTVFVCLAQAPDIPVDAARADLPSRSQ